MPSPTLEIAPGRWIGEGEPCFVVAEVGQNHNGDSSLARQLIETAANSGADAVKFCKRHLPGDLTREGAARPYESPHSFGATYGEHRAALELSVAEHSRLKRFAESRGIIWFSTVCDRHSAEEIDRLGTQAFKIASRDLANLPLLDFVASRAKPIVLSCGMDDLETIRQAVRTVRQHHDMLVLLQCTSAYPTDYADVNLRAMQTLREEFDAPVGFSDHTPGVAATLAAVALGAVLIERHITLDRRMKGADHACSLAPDELARLVREVRQVEAALGDGEKRVPPSVSPARAKLGRSLVSSCPIPRGVRIEESMLCLKSPGGGLGWEDRHALVGKPATRDIPSDVALSLADVATTAEKAHAKAQRRKEI